MSFKKRVLLAVVPLLGFIVINLLKLTCKNRFHIDENIKDEPYIIAFWHGNLLMQPFIYNRARKKSLVNCMISEHSDGEALSKLISFFGFKSIRGSSSKGSKRVLIAAINSVKAGEDVAITPDGPKGPRHSIADGIVAIAQKTDTKIVVFKTTASRYYQLKSWDRFEIPKFFSQIDYYALEPFSVSGLDIDSAKEEIRKRMA